ncbi:hypothetical protein ACFFX0_22685 [Citricoccus parietis]|uniref:Secreted protein n=1 Tax=Citricoccus parietis TaxID=592307 RepID=A0ABV5G4I8_9MICC
MHRYRPLYALCLVVGIHLIRLGDHTGFLVQIEEDHPVKVDALLLVRRRWPRSGSERRDETSSDALFALLEERGEAGQIKWQVVEVVFGDVGRALLSAGKGGVDPVRW